MYTILKNSSWLLCFLFLFMGCTSTPEKKINKAYTVEIKQMQFQPASLTVQKGDTVIWINHDIVAHDVTEEKDKLWTSGPLAPGESWSKVVTESADYYCSIHVVMKGKLVVQ
ncbi:MAG: cupredoxin domain-containing protein [Chitinophagaceae bacterium]|nr:cupredoxin domain-containing protein [Chitinophagaceae bacterium]